jgi:acyl-CoA reductase-like NAD-dependent aldehyde dehydrogenase
MRKQISTLALTFALLSTSLSASASAFSPGNPNSHLKTSTAALKQASSPSDTSTEINNELSSISMSSKNANLDVAALRAPMQGTHDSGINGSFSWRMEQLKTLKRMVYEHWDELLEVLYTDLGKQRTEAAASEMIILAREIDFLIDNLQKLMAPTKVASPGVSIPAFSTITPRPKSGPACLVIGPSNYPVSLSLQPVAGSLAAGNPTVLKPSELASATSALLHRLVTEYFDPSAFSVLLGGIPETTALLQESWGLIFFTGSQSVGKIVAAAAAQTLTPTVLELGGKSPCYVDETAPSDISAVANRIIWAKTMNAGQTCAAVDTLIVHESIVDRLLPELVKALETQFGPDPAQGELGRMVDTQHADRHVEMIQQVENAVEALSSTTGTNDAAEDTSHGCKIICGGSNKCDVQSNYICPTIVLNPPRDCRLLKEEIFGPILPVVTIQSRDEAIQLMRDMPGTPLCLYVFTESSRVFDEISQKCPSGSTMHNDGLVHLTSPFFAFGGLGSSGYGGYHGKYSFETFSHQHFSMYRPVFPGLEVMARYHPYAKKGAILEAVLLRAPDVPVLHVRAWLLVATVALGCRYVPPLQNLTEMAMTTMAVLLETIAALLRESASSS